MAFAIGTRAQIRAIISALSSGYPLDGTRGGAVVEGARTTRYTYAQSLADGRWFCVVRAADVPSLSVPQQALVQSIATTTDGTHAYLDGSQILASSSWWRPVVMRATQEDLPADVPVGEVVEHLWDTTEADPAGTRYVRGDGLREFVVQIVDSSPGDSVVVLWFYGDQSDPGEVAYAQGLLYAAVGLGLATEVVECSYDNGAWIVGALSSEVAARWPSSWRVRRPGDGATPTGERCVREVIL